MPLFIAPGIARVCFLAGWPFAYGLARSRYGGSALGISFLQSMARCAALMNELNTMFKQNANKLFMKNLNTEANVLKAVSLGNKKPRRSGVGVRGVLFMRTS